MYKKARFLTFILIFLMVVMPSKSAFAEQETGRMPGAWIEAVSCDAQANPQEDFANDNSLDSFFPERSCIGQGVDRESFKVKVVFEPKLPDSGSTTTVTVPGEPQFAENTQLPVYTSAGTPIQTCDGTDCTPVPLTDEGFIHTGEGVQIQYTGQIHDENGDIATVYNEPVHREPVSLDYPSSGTLNDENDIPLKYSASCPHGGHTHAVGENIQYENGTELYSGNCQPIEDCNGVIVSGSTMYLERNGVCTPMTRAGNAINSVLGPETTEAVEVGLFAARFIDEYNDGETDISAIEEEKASLWMSIGQSAILIPNSFIRFEVVSDGNKACVYAYDRKAKIRWRVEDRYPLNMNQVNDILDNGNGLASITPGDRHCVKTPTPVIPFKKLSWGEMISDACTDPEARASKWRVNISSTVVQCVEESMTRIFLPEKRYDENGDEIVLRDAQGNEIAPGTFFTNMQSKLQSAIRGILALYIIFFGFNLLVAKEVPERSEWMWLGVKMSLVVYFALGPGMTDLLPRIMDTSKGLSIIFMEAGMDADPTPVASASRRALHEASAARDEAQRLVNEQMTAIMKIQSDFAIAEQKIYSIQAALDSLRKLRDEAKDIAGDALIEKTAKEEVLNSAITELELAQESYNNALATTPGGAVNSIDLVDEGLRERLCRMGGACHGGVLGVDNGGFLEGSVLDDANDKIEGAEGEVVAAQKKVNATKSKANDAAKKAQAAINKFDLIGYTKYMQIYNQQQVILASATAELQASKANLEQLKNQYGIAEIEAQLAEIQAEYDAALQIAEAEALQQNSTSGGDVDYGVRYDLCMAGGACYGGILNLAEGSYYPDSTLELAQKAFDIAATSYDNLLLEYTDLEDQIVALEAELDAALNLYNNPAQIIADANDLLDQYAEELEERNATVKRLSAELSAVISEAEANNNNAGKYSWGGYDYCRFADVEYEVGKESARLWDILDCKFSKYMGIGDFKSMPNSPAVLGVSALMAFGFYSAWGFPILILSIIFLIFVFMVMLRIVHIYLLAFIGLMLLVYISPLVIPAALFKWSKDIFDQWFKQIVAYTIQPVIMFAFLAMMFFMMDHVVFGGNHNFVESVKDGKVISYKIRSEPGSESSSGPGDLTDLIGLGGMSYLANDGSAVGPDNCKDRSAPGCVYQTVSFTKKDLIIDLGFTDFVLAEDAINTIKDKKQPFELFNGLLQLILICFIIHIILKQVEALSASLVEAVGGGASAMAQKGGVPVFSVAQIASGLATATGQVADKGERLAGFAARGVNRGPSDVADAYNAAKTVAQAAGRGVKNAPGKKAVATYSNYKQNLKDGKEISEKTGVSKKVGYDAAKKAGNVKDGIAKVNTDESRLATRDHKENKGFGGVLDEIKKGGNPQDRLKKTNKTSDGGDGGNNKKR